MTRDAASLNRMPVYHQLNERLLALLRGGEYRPGDRFLTEREVAARFALSRITANKALSGLVAAGHLEFRKGVGSFVRGESLENDLRALVSFTHKAARSGRKPSTRVLVYRRLTAAAADESLCQELEVQGSEVLIYVERKVAARFQCRLGPTRVGPFGLFQTLADTLKLVFKEDFVPQMADQFLHMLAPFLALLVPVVLLALLPYSPSMQVADLNIGILFVTAIGGFLFGYDVWIGYVAPGETGIEQRSGTACGGEHLFLGCRRDQAFGGGHVLEAEVAVALGHAGHAEQAGCIDHAIDIGGIGTAAGPDRRNCRALDHQVADHRRGAGSVENGRILDQRTAHRVLSFAAASGHLAPDRRHSMNMRGARIGRTVVPANDCRGTGGFPCRRGGRAQARPGRGPALAVKPGRRSRGHDGLCIVGRRKAWKPGQIVAGAGPGTHDARRELDTMGNLKVTMHDVNGQTHVIENADDGISLMELAKQNGVAGIMGDCGGGCACATCHVYVGDAWWSKVGEPDDIEFAMLDMVSDVQQPHSRLGCQIKMRADLDGIEVTVAPSSSY